MNHARSKGLNGQRVSKNSALLALFTALVVASASLVFNPGCDSGGADNESSDGDESSGNSTDTDDADGSDESNSSTETNTSDSTNADELAFEPCAPGTRVGGFLLKLVHEGLVTSLSGRVRDGVEAIDDPILQSESGSCRLLKERVNICDPQCASGEYCNNELKCVPAPVAHNVGIVAVTGMNVPVEMEPKMPGFSYYKAGLPQPGYDAGARLELESEGGDYAPLHLVVRGVEAIDAPLDPVVAEADSPLTVTWVPAAADPAVRIEIEVKVNRHGSTPIFVSCESEDVGTFEIPAEAITAILDAGVTGFPEVKILRRSIASAELEPGCVDFVSLSEIAVPIEVPGVVSCQDDSDCPDGQTCQGDLTCG
jgi:hypothetical protein